MSAEGGSARDIATGPDGELGAIRAAMLDLVVAHGCQEATLEAVLARAGVGLAAFERHFESFDDCYLQLFEQFTAEFDRATFGGFEGTEGPWRRRLRAAAYGAARYIRDHPRESAFSSTLMFGAGDVAQAYRERHLRRLVDLIDAGRAEMDDPGAVNRAVAEGVLGSIYSVVTRLLAEGGVESIDELVPEMMYVAVRPYLGHEVAREELTIPPPPEPEAGGEGGGCS